MLDGGEQFSAFSMPRHERSTIRLPSGDQVPAGFAARLGQRSDDGLGQRRHLESFYFAFGETDAYVILDVPDNRTAVAASMAVNAAGAATSEVVVLLTPEDVDAASKLSVEYQSPGS